MGNQFLPFINFFLLFMQPLVRWLHLMIEISSIENKVNDVEQAVEIG